MSTEPEVKEVKKNPEAQGAHILKSYLTALKIPFMAGEKVNEVKVTAKKGGSISVVVGNGEAQIKLDPAIITSFELPKALGALHCVTEAAGYGKPSPINRGEAHAGRVNYLDNFEDVYLRHSIFRRSPNKEAAELEPYMPTIKRCVRKALFRWKKVFSAMGFGEGDLLTAGMVYTVSYLHHYSYAVEEIDNIKLLTDYLKQRFGEMAKIVYKKALNATCLPQAIQSASVREDGEETSYIDTFAEAEEASPDEEYEEDAFVLTFKDGKEHTLQVENDGMLGLNMILDGRMLTRPEATKLVEEIRSGAVDKRRVVIAEPKVTVPEESSQVRATHARKELMDKLLSLDPAKREILLGYAALSRDYAPDARREARKLCDELVCPKCEKRVPSGVYCQSCEVEAVPRLGVDYMAFREKLAAENHPMAEAMSAQIPESEVRSRAKRPPVVGAKSLANAKEQPIEIKKVQPTKSKAEIDAMIDAMAADLMTSLPEKILCPKCKVVKTKAEFGIRVAKDKATGIPARASRQSYCKPCRKPA